MLRCSVLARTPLPPVAGPLIDLPTMEGSSDTMAAHAEPQKSMKRCSMKKMGGAKKRSRRIKKLQDTIHLSYSARGEVELQIERKKRTSVYRRPASASTRASIVAAVKQPYLNKTGLTPKASAKPKQKGFLNRWLLSKK